MNLLNIFALSGLANFILSTAFGFLVYTKNPKEKRHFIFFILSLVIAGWALNYYLWLSSYKKETALLYLYGLSGFSIWIPILYFHWLLLTLKLSTNTKLIKFLKLVYIIGGILTSSLIWNPSLIVKDVKKKIIFPYWPDAGLFYSFYIIFIYIGLVIFGLLLITKKIFETHDKKDRNSLVFLWISSLLGFGGGFFNFFLWYDIPVIPYGNIFVGLYVILFGYATLEFRFFNIKLIGTEFFVYILLLTLVINLFKPQPSIYEFSVNLVLTLFSSIVSLLLLKYAYKETEYTEKLETLNRIKSEFLSFASHQVKAPMAVVKGYAELIAEGAENVPEQVKEFAHKIKDSVDNLLVLIEEFMDYRRIEENKLEFHFEEVELVSLTKEIVNNFSLIAKNKGLELSFETNMEQCIIKADRIRISQVIQNIIDNAIKYTPQGWVKVNLYKENGNIIISVADSGIGMSKELQSKLFSEFVRDPSIKKEIRGTGLGLYIAKNIVEAHKGKIWAESEGEGKGSKFYIKLPLL